MNCKRLSPNHRYHQQQQRQHFRYRLRDLGNRQQQQQQPRRRGVNANVHAILLQLRYFVISNRNNYISNIYLCMKMSSCLPLLLTCCVRQGIKCPSSNSRDERGDTTDAPIANVSINCAWACCQSQAVEEKEADAAAAPEPDVSSSNVHSNYPTNWQWHHSGNDQPGVNNFYLPKRNSF